MSAKSRFKDFGAGVEKDASPLSFKLHGEEFQCVPRIQGKVLLDLVAMAGDTSPQGSADTMNLFFKSVLRDESYEKFEALTRDKDKIVEVQTLAEIVSWLMEEYSDRPPTEPED
jgi:hypothetical protein